jgi:acyl dehydratase
VPPAFSRCCKHGGDDDRRGFPALKLLSRMSVAAAPEIENAAMGLNCGMSRMRFIAPVRAGERDRRRSPSG